MNPKTAAKTTGTRMARKNVEEAFAPIAVKLGLNFKPNQEVDYTAQNATFISGLKGGDFIPVTIGSDGATRPVFPKLSPRNASQLTDIFNALEAVIPAKA